MAWGVEVRTNPFLSFLSFSSSSTSLHTHALNSLTPPSSYPTGGAAKYRGTWDCVSKIWAHEGIFGYFKGVVPNALKVAPSAAITFVVYEETLKLLSDRR